MSTNFNLPNTPSATPLTYPNALKPAPEKRNLVAEFKDKLDEEIRSSLNDKRSEMVNICMNLTGDFNKSSIIRANNAFLGKAVYLVGRRKFNTRGTVGTHLYENMNNVPYENWQDLFTELINDGYTIFPVDNVPEFDPVVVNEVEFPAKSAFLYGEEGDGLAREVIEACNGQMVYIRQRGSVRSLNVAQAAAITMSFYDSQHVDF